MGLFGRCACWAAAGILTLTGCAAQDGPDAVACHAYADVVDGALDAMHGVRDGAASVDEAKIAKATLDRWLVASPSAADAAVGGAIKATSTGDEASLRESALRVAAKCSAVGAPISIH